MESIKQSYSRSAGFSLIEVSIASAIVITSGLLLALALQRASQSTDSSRTVDDAIWIEEVVRFRLREIGFDDVFAALKKQNVSFFAYPYRGAKAMHRSDGSLVPSQEKGWLVTHGLRQSDDPLLERDMETVIGQVYRLRLTPFGNDSEIVQVLPGDANELTTPYLRVSVEIFRDFDPEVYDEPWPSRLRVLSFPLTIPR